MSFDGFGGARIAVIGAGALGSAVTYRAAKAGAAVTIIDQSYPGSGTSGNSFAWLNAFNKLPRDYYQLNMRSIQDHRDLQDEVGAQWAVRPGGLHWADSTDAAETQRLEDTIKRLASWGTRIEKLDPASVVKDLEPDLFLDPDTVDHVYFLPGEGWLNPSTMVTALLGMARRRYSAQQVTGEVTEVVRSHGEATGVKLADGSVIEADVVICTAGPGSNRFLNLSDTGASITHIPGALPVLAPAPVTVQHVLRGPKDLCVRPDGGQRLLLGWADTLSLTEDYHPTIANAGDERFEGLRKHVTALLPRAQGVPLETIRYGVRPMPADGHPIIGADPGIDGLYFAVMHSGITLSARVSQLIVDDLLTEDGSSELRPYRPERFADGKVREVMATDE